VTIFGESFGTANSDATVKIADKDCPVISNTKSMIVCMAQAGTGMQLPVVVIIDGQSSAAVNIFNYAGPIVNDVEPANGAKEIAITVFGQNFGEETSDVVVTIGNKPCVISAWLGPQRLMCLTPDTTGKNLPIQVSVHGQKSEINPDVTFSYGDNRPQVVSITPTSGPVEGGNSVTIVGANLDSPMITVEFGEGNRATVTKRTENTIIIEKVPRCPITPPGLVVVVVKDDGEAVLGSSSFTYSYIAPSA